MRGFLRRLFSLVVGLFLYAAGIVLCIQANIGCAPWDVLHMGLSFKLGITMGQVSILVGAVVCLIVFLLREKLGIGTLLNMLLIGVFMDLLFALKIIPLINQLWVGVLVMVTGLFVIALGSYFYIGSGFGAGPRDSLMVCFKRRTGWPVGACRALVEGSALLLGYFLGGQVGIGTVMAVFGISFCIQIVFSLLRFDPAAVRHETLVGTWRALRIPTNENQIIPDDERQAHRAAFDEFFAALAEIDDEPITDEDLADLAQNRVNFRREL